MYSRRIQKDSTNKSVVVKMTDVSTDMPATSIGFNTAGLVMKYYRVGSTAFDVSMAPTSVGLSSDHSDGGIRAIAAGWCRVDVPDAAFATGADGVLIMVETTIGKYGDVFIELTDYNPGTNTPQSTPENY